MAEEAVATPRHHATRVGWWARPFRHTRKLRRRRRRQEYANRRSEWETLEGAYSQGAIDSWIAGLKQPRVLCTSQSRSERVTEHHCERSPLAHGPSTHSRAHSQFRKQHARCLVGEDAGRATFTLGVHRRFRPLLLAPSHFAHSEHK